MNSGMVLSVVNMHLFRNISGLLAIKERHNSISRFFFFRGTEIGFYVFFHRQKEAQAFFVSLLLEFDLATD